MNYTIRIIFTILLYSLTTGSMAATDHYFFSTNGYTQGDTALTTLSVHQETYKLIMRGDSADTTMPGAGIFEGMLTSQERQKIAIAYERAKEYGPLTPTPIIDQFIRSFYAKGDRIVKLDATVNIAPTNGALLVTVEFINTGREELCLRSPATWEGTYNPIAGSSWIAVSAKRSDTSGLRRDQRELRTGFFGGSAMLNASEFPNDLLCIPSMQTRTARFRVFPQASFKKGQYSIGASMVLRVVSPAELKGVIEMNSVNQMIEFPHDYPSTPNEIEAFSDYLRSKQQH
ncbi:hypothetical protein [Caballeronia sp. Sq4a]|uniref:hypothetical protein n=1 Tax=Caballeronia sp. Sq4a TaxID=2878152 RepID=UPI0020C097E5|nr:hypothetical protein [Caballeronia sp. Sq4a]